MRTFNIAATAGLIVLAFTGFATSASYAEVPPRESFVMTFHTFDGVDQPTRVSARGPVAGAGVETQVDEETDTGEVLSLTWHLPRGDVLLDAVENFDFSFDPTSCTAKATGTGTWSIVGGTGDYAGAHGQGTFDTHGSFVGARGADGSCQGPETNTEPRVSVFTLRGTGTAGLS